MLLRAAMLLPPRFRYERLTSPARLDGARLIYTCAADAAVMLTRMFCYAIGAASPYYAIFRAMLLISTPAPRRYAALRDTPLRYALPILRAATFRHVIR